MDNVLVSTGLISLLAGLAAGALAVHIVRVFQGNKGKKAARKQAQRIVNRAQAQAQKIERESKTKAKDFENRARRNVEGEIRKQKQKNLQTQEQLKNKEQQIKKEYQRKEEELDREIERLNERDHRIEISEGRVQKLEKETQEKKQKLEEKLENLSQLTVEEAREELMGALEQEAQQSMAARLEEIEQTAVKEAEVKAKQVLSAAISRYASEVATERTVSIIGLSSDEMKGKIIGREGRNIRALEAACGVDLIVDETPESVVISCFDPIRREVARQTLEKLMEDGRVHPARIEEVVSKVKAEILNTVKEDGEKACFDLGASDIHPHLQKLIGELKYRRSNMLNLYKQSIEVACIAGMLAAEVGYSEALAKRAGLLHAVGRALSHTLEGPYATVGAEYAKRYGEKDVVVQAIRCHNGGVEARTVLDNLVQAAYNFSEARPGVKRPSMETYIKRLEDLESIGNSFDGVARTYAVQAGKEIRVLVDGGKITDDQAAMVVRDIARKVERELNYPGQIKVSVVRETRIVEHAR